MFLAYCIFFHFHSIYLTVPIYLTLFINIYDSISAKQRGLTHFCNFIYIDSARLEHILQAVPGNYLEHKSSKCSLFLSFWTDSQLEIKKEKFEGHVEHLAYEF